MKKLLPVLLILAISYNASGQISTFLESGKSGMGFSALARQGEGFYGFGGNISGTIKGKLDLELHYKYDTYTKEALDMISDKALSNVMALRSRYWIFREKIHPAVDLNFGVIGNLVYSDIKGLKTYMDNGDLMESKYFTEMEFGAGGSADFRVGEKWYVEPSFFLVKKFGIDYWTEGQVEMHEGYQATRGIYGLALFRRTEKGAMFIQATHYGEATGLKSWINLAAGYAFSF
jgi:hypothetical protein